MKKGKARLIFSIVCLVLAAIFAVFVCYAWFVQNLRADTDGVEAVTTSGDVKQFTVVPYLATTADGKTYNVETDEVLKEMGDFMPRTGISGSTTAVLLKMQYEVTVSGTFDLDVRVNHSDPYRNDSESFDEKENIWDNYLSNVIFFQEATKTSADTSVTGDYTLQFTQSENTSVPVGRMTFFEGGFYTGDYGEDTKLKSSVISMDEFEVASNQVDTLITRYFIMDYIDDNVMTFYSIILDMFNGKANLSTRIEFNQDIYFTLGRPDNTQKA